MRDSSLSSQATLGDSQELPFMQSSGRREPSREEEVSVCETVPSLAGGCCGKAGLAAGLRLVQYLDFGERSLAGT